MSASDTYKYVDNLDDLVANYNSSIHSGIKAKPLDVWNGKATPFQRENTADFSSYPVGTQVRIAEPRTKFSKSSDERWSDSIHTIREIVGNRFLVSDKKENLASMSY
jgi:hypothetical protein